MKNGKEKSMFVREYLWRDLMTVCGLFVILLTIVIGAFLVYKGSSTFLVYRHSFLEFLGSADWAPEDNMAGGGSIGALIFIAGSLCTCGLALLIATPFSLGSAIFITEISPKFGEKFYRPVVEIFAGIPSVVYGWVGLTVLVPAIKTVFDRQVGHSILAAGLVLAVMIFPTITSVAADALHSVPKECRMAAYGLGSTRWQTIYRIVVPAAAPGIRTLDHGTAVIRNLPVLHLPDPSCDSGEAGERRKNKHFRENKHDRGAGKAVRSKGGKLDHGK